MLFLDPDFSVYEANMNWFCVQKIKVNIAKKELEERINY